LARSYHLPFEAGRSRHRPNKASLEQEARLQRFAFFNELARRYRADGVALAHSRDDLAETVLMRLIRGGGLKGLAAITPKRLIHDALYIRPLLFASREEILHYRKARKLAWREDATNKQKKYFRNLIRLELLPLLERKYNPNIKEVLAQTADNAATDYDFLLQQARKEFTKTAVSTRDTKVVLKLKAFKILHPSMQRLVWRLAIERLTGNTRRITFKHWQQLDAMVQGRPESALVKLPKEVRAAKDENNIKLYISKA
jgi:tRNA(Ile)-lysidine synthase